MKLRVEFCKSPFFLCIFKMRVGELENQTARVKIRVKNFPTNSKVSRTVEIEGELTEMVIYRRVSGSPQMKRNLVPYPTSGFYRISMLALMS